MLLLVTELVPIAGNGVPGVLGSGQAGACEARCSRQGALLPHWRAERFGPRRLRQPWAPGAGAAGVPESRRLPRGPHRARASACPWGRPVTHLRFPRARVPGETAE